MRWALLDGLSDADREDVLAATKRRRFRRGETIFHEGDPGDTLHLIERGHVAVRIPTALGESATIRILTAGQWFGEMALIGSEPRMATMVALDAVETRTLHRDDFLALSADHPPLDRVLLDAMTAEVRRLSRALADAMYLPVPRRVARILLQLTEQYPSATIPLTQDDLAGLCGATRQTVNQVLSELQASGAVTLGRGRVTVTDPDLLARAAR